MYTKSFSLCKIVRQDSDTQLLLVQHGGETNYVTPHLNNIDYSRFNLKLCQIMASSATPRLVEPPSMELLSLATDGCQVVPAAATIGGIEVHAFLGPKHHVIFPRSSIKIEYI